ncbi:MAG: hypothetical protein LBP52_09350 [Burkholderiaceae bacterium]|jgi:hypothetical protein|nr:hypothetical protein [Burkholderiaceae bacterium]
MLRQLFLCCVLTSILSACGGGSESATASAFDIKATGPNSLMPENPDDAKDPTTYTSAAGGTNPSVGASNPYFQERSGITVETLKALMNDATTFPSVEDPVIVTIGADRYTGYRLADVVVRATRFRPADYNTGAFGVTTAIIADGADGRHAVFSFTELIRSENGNKTIVAYEKNGQPLPGNEGRMAVVAGNDIDLSLRRVNHLSALRVRNDYVKTSHTLPSGASAPALTSDDIRFQITGAVKTPLDITAALPSTSSDQGYYAVVMIGNRDAASLPTYYFQEYGPRHMNFWWGQGVRLTDVLDTAGLSLPDEKNRCFVVIESGNNQHALFSCGELYNSRVGIGDGVAGTAAAPNRSRSKGVLLVTDDLRSGTGNGVMMTCWNDLSTCTKNNAGDPDAYTANMDANGDRINYQSIALVSTEDKVPFTPAGRWYPLDNCVNTVWKCNPWIDVGERLQQGIKSITVHYVDGS